MPAHALLLSLLLPVPGAPAVPQPAPTPVAAAAEAGPLEAGPLEVEREIKISGSVELDQAAAQSSARVAFEEWGQAYGVAVLESAVDRARPVWVPGSWLLRVAREQMDPWSAEDLALVVDREVVSRQHEFGMSYQVNLALAERPAGLQRFQRSVQSAVRGAERVLLMMAGGTVVYWGALFLLVGWFDRLTRGYMTRRLALLGVLAAVAVPPLPFLF